MLIIRDNEKIVLIENAKDCSRTDAYKVETGKNGKKFVTRDSVSNDRLNVTPGNSKTGEHVVTFNFSIECTCDHRCECYKESLCYAESGCYMFADNQAKYTENINFFLNSTVEQFCAAMQIAIDKFGYKLFRYFTCGDIPNIKFIDCMVKLAIDNPGITFWTYTKKYGLVNKWIESNGNLPDNLTVIFSHWLNKDGTYFSMNNPYNLPTSEFIPYGKEELKESVTHVCPCSDPSVVSTCETCDYPCYRLKHGESMALLEHSTSATKNRDKQIKAAKESLKKAAK